MMTSNDMIKGQDAIKMVLLYELDSLAEAESFEYVYRITNDNKTLQEIAEGMQNTYEMLKDVIADVPELANLKANLDFTLGKFNKCIATLGR